MTKYDTVIACLSRAHRIRVLAQRYPSPIFEKPFFRAMESSVI